MRYRQRSASDDGDGEQSGKHEHTRTRHPVMAKHRRGRVLLRRNRAFDTRLAALRIGLKKRARGIEIRILARSRGRCTVDLRKIEVTHGMETG